MGPGGKGSIESSDPTDTDHDVVFLNDAPPVYPGAAASLSRPEMATLQAQLRAAAERGDDFVTVPLPRLALAGSETTRAAAEAVAAYKRETGVVDARLFRKVTLGVKATALSDFCDEMRAETGINLTAGRSVGDEKVTLFCRNAPLRDVMRQLGRPFGYTWLRSGKEKEYRYELVQDLRSQLLEEELRNRDRNEALLALDRGIGRYRKYLHLSPDEALEEAKKAPPEEKRLLEQYATTGWAPTQLYFRLTPGDLAQLRAGRTIFYGPGPVSDPDPGGRPTTDAIELVTRRMPVELGRGALQGLRDYRVRLREGRPQFGTAAEIPDGATLGSLSNPDAVAIMRLDQNELGQYRLFASSGVQWTSGETIVTCTAGDPLALGVSPMVARPDNRRANANLARDPVLQRRVADLSPLPVSSLRGDRQGGEVEKPEVTTADVLEAFHRATGVNLVADYYTRLYPASELNVRKATAFDALNRLADTMRLRWDKEADWLRFRSTSYFNDRLKEVPNRLLRRWANSRREHGGLSLDDLIEIAQLAEAQLDSRQMAEGARALFGLAEWGLARHPQLRHHLRYLIGFSPVQREQARSVQGLPFTRMALTQQQGFLSLAVARDEAEKLRIEDLAGAGVRVVYTLPGAFQWARPQPPGTPLWQKPLPSPVCEPTREAALVAARRIDPTADASQIVPTKLNLEFVYTLNPEKRRHLSYR